MTTTEMVALVKQRTKVADESKITRELSYAQRWVARRVFNTTGGPELLTTIGEELEALAETTREYDLGANVSGGEFLGLKQLWLKLPSDTRFTLMTEVDAMDREFTRDDSATADNPDIAQGHPVYYTVVNFSKLRFARALPSGAVLRADYFRVAPILDPATNNTTENGSDLPAIFHDAMIHKATAQLFGTLDDEREGAEENRARDCINDAILIANGRVQGPQRTKPFRTKRRRFF